MEKESQVFANQILSVINWKTDLAFALKNVKIKKRIAPVWTIQKKYAKKDPFAFSQVPFQM